MKKTNQDPQSLQQVWDWKQQVSEDLHSKVKEERGRYLDEATNEIIETLHLKRASKQTLTKK